MGVCAVATPVRDAVGAVGALTVEVSVPSASTGARTCSRGAVLRHRDLAHRALLGAARASPGLDRVASGPRVVAAVRLQRFRNADVRDADS